LKRILTHIQTNSKFFFDLSCLKTNFGAQIRINGNHKVYF
jgi:hypothetical protein